MDERTIAERLDAIERKVEQGAKAAFSVTEAAKYAAMGASKMRDLLKNDEIDHIKNGTSYIVPRASLDSWLQAKSKGCQRI